MEWIQFLQIVCVPAFGWLFYRYIDLKKEIDHVRTELNQYKIEAVKEYATQAHILRLENKIDDLRDLLIQELHK